EVAALSPRHGRAEQAEAADPVRRAQPDLDRDAAAERVPDQMSALYPLRLHESRHRAGEPGRVIRRTQGLRGGPESGEVDRVDRVAGREGRDGLEEARLVAPQAVDQDDVLDAVAGGQGGDARLAGPDLVDANQRGPPV